MEKTQKGYLNQVVFSFLPALFPRIGETVEIGTGCHPLEIAACNEQHIKNLKSKEHELLNGKGEKKFQGNESFVSL